MEDVSEASTQNADIVGTVSIDGHTSADVLQRLMQFVDTEECGPEGCKGYYPLGLRVYFHAPLGSPVSSGKTASRDGHIDVGLLCVDTENCQGFSGNEREAFLRDTPSFNLFEFPLKLTLDQFLEHVKRFEMVAYLRGMKGKPVQVCPNR